MVLNALWCILNDILTESWPCENFSPCFPSSKQHLKDHPSEYSVFLSLFYNLIYWSVLQGQEHSPNLYVHPTKTNRKQQTVNTWVIILLHVVKWEGCKCLLSMNPSGRIIIQPQQQKSLHPLTSKRVCPGSMIAQSVEKERVKTISIIVKLLSFIIRASKWSFLIA